MKEITHFQGQYRFLSNFYPAIVEMYGQMYPTVEHAFQAAKTHGAHREEIRTAATPAEAKRLGRAAPLRENWEAFRLTAMLELLRRKFAHGSVLSCHLLATGDAQLVEGNTWGDTFWGVCRGEGENHLGLLLMQVREELRGAGGESDAPF